jgi:diguanylate cyclase (GGDEF)-like protein/MYXO-CTERM domain-containing protein
MDSVVDTPVMRPGLRRACLLALLVVLVPIAAFAQGGPPPPDAHRPPPPRPQDFAPAPQPAEQQAQPPEDSIAPLAAPAPIDPLADAVDRARASTEGTALVQALLALAEGRIAQSRPAEATAAIEEAARVAAQLGDDRLGREAALAGVAAYEAQGDTELAEHWRQRADAYRARIEGRMEPVPALPQQASSPASASTPDAVAPTAIATAGSDAAEPSPAWPWVLGAATLLLLWAWRRSHRRALELGDETERLARHQRHLRHAHQELQRQADHLRQTATQDALTGALMRTAFAHGLDQMLQHAQRFGMPAALFVFDLDHFKQINDAHGHLAGDAALKLVVGVAREKLDSADLLGRFGGDEFLVAAIRDRAEDFPALAESLRAALRERVAGDPQLSPLSLSLGIAVVDGNEYTPDALFARADTALYAAKRGGRDRCVLADAQPAEPTAETPLRTLAG